MILFFREVSPSSTTPATALKTLMPLLAWDGWRSTPVARRWTGEEQRLAARAVSWRLVGCSYVGFWSNWTVCYTCILYVYSIEYRAYPWHRPWRYRLLRPEYSSEESRCVWKIPQDHASFTVTSRRWRYWMKVDLDQHSGSRSSG
jgi:hypothetical protein